MHDSVVLFPTLGMGHLIPFVELAKLLTTTATSLSVTVVILQSPIFSSAIAAVDSLVSRVSSSHPSISFLRLPPVSSPSSSPLTPSLFIQIIRLATPLLLDFLTTLSQTSNIRSLVLDMFCTSALDVADDLNLPAYFFFSSGASALAAFLYFTTFQSEMSHVTNFNDLETPFHFPGIPPFLASHLPQGFGERSHEIFKEIIYHFERIPKSRGIMINTFEELETTAVKALVDGLCVPGRNMPPVYCIGPIIADNEKAIGEKHECLTWLDAQPKGSVVFLCFGSRGSFPPEQLREMANGLERSGQRFLWVVRNPQSNTSDEPDLEVLLPEGFVERNREKGMVVKSWAPQVAVLRHEAVGGFVSHCGWNSTLEALSCGVGMIAWPLYAEQRLNKLILVEEAKVAVEMEGFDKEKVSGEEVERKVRWLMETEGGEKVRARAREMKEQAAAARREGGSSDKAWEDFVRMMSE